MCPVTPAEVEACIINPDDPPCTTWRKLLKAFYLFWKVRNYENADDGGLGEDFAEDLCAITCPEVIEE